MKISLLKAHLFLFFTIYIFLNTGYSQQTKFVREKIEINLDSARFHINGDYFFKNTSTTPIKRNLFYPFPIDSCLTYPDPINIFSVQKHENISFLRVKKGIFFSIEIPPQKTVLYKVFYSQSTVNNKAEYILTTTKKWGKALEKADFIIKIPSELELKFLSYDYDEIEKIDEYLIYKIHKENFMPQKNLIVEWGRREK